MQTVAMTNNEREVSRVEPLPLTVTRTPAQGAEEQRNWQGVLLNDANQVAIKAVGSALGTGAVLGAKAAVKKIKGGGTPPAGGPPAARTLPLRKEISCADRELSET